MLRTPPVGRPSSPDGATDSPRRGRPPARAGILRAGRLAGIEPDELAQRFGTPLYVYDLDVVTGQVHALRAALPPRAELAYAVKANPSLAVLAHVRELGLGADVASGGELAAVGRAGFAADRVVMTGPGKRDDELRAAVRAGIRALTVESPGELARLEGIAAEERPDRPTPVMLRAAVGLVGPPERVRLVGDDGAGKFGMGASDLADAARRAARSPDLELVGLHAFGASNVLDADALVAHAAATARTARALAEAAGTPFRLVDVGGGLGIPYEPIDRPLDVGRLGRGLAELVDGWAGDRWLGEARLLLEPGRFIAGPAGAYLARVVDRKVVDGTTVVILDGGVHHLLRPALVGQEQAVRSFGRRDAACKRWPVTIAGPLCSGLDVLAAQAVIVPPEVGDLVAVLDAGAYGYTESMPLFLSHPVPAEVAVRGDRAELVRPRIEPTEWLERQLMPDW